MFQLALGWASDFICTAANQFSWPLYVYSAAVICSYHCRMSNFNSACSSRLLLIRAKPCIIELRFWMSKFYHGNYLKLLKYQLSNVHYLLLLGFTFCQGSNRALVREFPNFIKGIKLVKVKANTPIFSKSTMFFNFGLGSAGFLMAH